MKGKQFICLVILGVLWVSTLNAQTTRQSGVIRGIVTDVNGEPLPGVNVVANSPALIGSQYSVTSNSGSYRCVNLPPGEYTITAELSGFQTVRQEGIIVHVGITLTVNFTIPQATITEDVMVIAVAPTIDLQSQKLTTRIDAETIANLPLGRSFRNLVSLTPGISGSISTDKMTAMGTGIIHGGTAYGQTFEVDGQNVVDPAHGGAILYTPQYDTIEEISIETGGLEAQVGNSAGNFINVVTKSGGNDFHGGVTFYYTQENLTEILYSDESLAAMGMVRPSSPIYDYEFSATVGGPIIKDKIWFFTNLAYEDEKSSSRFIPGFIEGKWVDQDNPSFNSFRDVMLKVSGVFSEKLRFSLTGAFSDQDRPGAGGTRATKETSHNYVNNDRMTLTGQASWLISSNSFLELRAGISRFDYPISYQSEEAGYIAKSDSYTGYSWGGPGNWASNIDRKIITASARFTHFMDNFLGGNHEFGMGAEYQRGKEQWWLYDYDTMRWYYYNDNPLYYRGLYNLTSPHPVYGDGYLRFQPWGPTPGETGAPSLTQRFGAYLQDTWVIDERIFLSLGLRFDTVKGYVVGAKKERAAGIAYEVGAQAIEPIYGFNPFDKLTTPDWDPAMKWSIISPRVGVSYDLFGNGKTALKASYSRYADNMPAMYFQGNHPFSNSQWGSNPLRFYWWDLNGNLTPDAPPTDTYKLFRGAVSDYDPDPATYTSKIDENLYAPTYNEFILGVDHELFKNTRISIKGFYRNKKGTLDNVLYDRATKKLWYTYEQAPEWYVPFTTIVPGIGEYPDQEVTVYLLSKDAPWSDRFYLFTNVEESKRQYSALELSFDKRYANGWSLGGSVVLSRLWSNVSGSGGTAHGFSSSFDDANYLVNREGLDSDDTTLAIKLYGFFDLPLGFFASFIATHYSASPWQRSVTVRVPTDWAAANNAEPLSASVNVEQQGSRRFPMNQVDMDFRIEKRFNIFNIGELGLYLEIFNLLGNRNIRVQQNPGGTWFPDDANTNIGRYVPQSRYGTVTSASGTRTYSLSFRFTF